MHLDGLSMLLTSRAVLQGSAFTRSDALACGHTDEDIRRWTGEGVIRPALRGSFYLAPSEDERERVSESAVRRARAAMLALPDNHVASHGTALLLAGVPRAEPVRAAETVHVMNVVTQTRSRREGVATHRCVPGTRYRLGPGRRVSVADAVVQYAAARGLEPGLIAADAALRLELARPAQLHEAAARLRGRRGSAVLPRLVELADGRSESPQETRTRLVCLAAGIDVTPQVEMFDADGTFLARVDLLVDGSRVVLEYDGLDKYRDDPDARAKEKQREHRLHRAGYVLVRVMAEDLRDPARLIARIRHALAQAA